MSKRFWSIICLAVVLLPVHSLLSAAETAEANEPPKVRTLDQALLEVKTPEPGSDVVTAAAKAKSDCELCEFEDPEFWIVNTRCAPRCGGLDAGFERITYQRWDRTCNRFVDETLESFLATQATMPTLLFAHGNTLTHEQAIESCWTVHERLKVCPGKKMFVVWSWPAQILYKRPLIRPIALARKNIQAKYVYAEYQGYYIAKLVNMMSTEQPLTLGGHSFGGVSAICALHYLGGGQLNGLVFEGGMPVERPNVRASIISGALDNDHCYPGHRYGQAFVAVEKFHTTFSTMDATLKRWPTHSFRKQQAMGYTGICAARLGENAHKLCQQRLTDDVGKSHYIKPHLASVQMITAVCQTAFNSTPVPGSGGGSSGGSRVIRGRTLDVPGVIEGVIQAPAQTVFPGLAL